jgi:hypothetical protein
MNPKRQENLRNSSQRFREFYEGQSSIDKKIQGAETHAVIDASERQLLEDIEKDGSMVTSACFPRLGMPVSMSPSNDDPLVCQYVQTPQSYHPEIVISKSKYTNCMKVSCETRPARTQQRLREMKEIEHFLNQDYRFTGYARELKFYPPGLERDAWLDNFFHRVWRGGHFKSEEVMIRSRIYQACVYTTLHDEHEAYLDQCGRTYGPSHVEDGGGDAFHSKSQVMHRSSAGTDGSSLGGSAVVGTESGPTTGLTDTCAGRSSPSNSSGAFSLEG